MRELDNLKKRLTYFGGNQEGRMINDKLRALRKALLYSYQAATLCTADGREFRCLINPDKTKNDYDQKILSIPYKDICLNQAKVGTTTQGMVETGIKCGDVFKWKETGTNWLIYLEHIEEDAYFRAEIRRCKTSVFIGENEYPIYIRGPVETTVNWLQKAGIEYSTLNYSLEIYITKNEETLDFFHRFKQLDIDGKKWFVKAIDTYGGDNIIQVLLGEEYSNTIEDTMYEEPKPSDQSQIQEPFIKGLDVVKPYDTITYSIANFEDAHGVWEVDNTKKTQILEQDSEHVVIGIITGKSGNFNITYKQDDLDLVLPVQIVSL